MELLISRPRFELIRLDRTCIKVYFTKFTIFLVQLISMQSHYFHMVTNYSHQLFTAMRILVIINAYAKAVLRCLLNGPAIL
jgi:hypothetical protein